MAMDRLSGVYLIILLSSIYSLTEPKSFFTVNNFRIVLSSQAITGILTLGLMVSLICGIFDLSIAANMGWSIIFFGWLQEHHLAWGLAAVITLGGGALIGVINALVVTKLNVDSVIGTLGMSSVLTAMMYWISGGQSISNGFSQSLAKLGSDERLSLPLPVYFFAAIAIVLWYVLGYTPTGRYFYAIGGNTAAARLAGLRVLRLQWLGLITSSTVAALAAIVFTAELGNASYDAGSPYLLPAFSAVFLGATQIKPGRFNVWGTVVSIYLLAVGVKGLELRWPAAPWITDLFDGAVLIVAVALAVRAARHRKSAS
jgi:ribose transport system permease protein